MTPPLVATYDYTDPDGKLLYQNCRFEPKDFRQRHRDIDGNWVWGRNGQTPTLYRLAEVTVASMQDFVLITEGEKDVESLRALGFIATTSGGASSWRPEFAEHFRGRLVAICGDNDTPGKRYVDNVAKSLAGVAGEIRIVELPDDSKDITEFIESHDHLDEQHLRGRIIALIDAAKPVRVADPTPRTVLVNAADWLVTEPAAPIQILTDTFDRGDKVAIIGSSKLRKSFFLLQGMLSVASGREFLGWGVPKPRRVVIAQFEIQAAHFHRRVRRMAAAMGITPGDLDDRLQIVNARGLGLAGRDGILDIAKIVGPIEPDIIAFDPLYKIASGAENQAEDLKVVLDGFDALAEQTGAAVVFVHHDAKGSSGDRDIRDRGAGSNVLGRDYDACITLTPHVSEDDAAVVEVLLRNYRPQAPFTMAWTEDTVSGGYRFITRGDITATKRTSANSRAAATAFEEVLPAALKILQGDPVPMAQFKDDLRAKTAMSRERTDGFVRWALLRPEADLDVFEKQGRGVHQKFIGTTDRIAILRGQSR